jgi:hypothetical protein
MQALRAFQFAILIWAGASPLRAGALDQWHSRTNFQATSIQDIAFGNGVWVVVDTPSAVITANDLISPKTFVRIPIPQQPYAVEFGAGRFVLACKDSLMSSTDGTNWSSHSTSPGLGSLLFAAGRFVAVGNRTVATSTDGATWSSSGLPGISTGDLAFGNGIFLVAGGRTNAISGDGSTWEAVPSGFDTGVYTVGFGDGKFIAITTRSEIKISTDARSWQTKGTVDVVRPGRIAYGNGYFVTAGANARANSHDGVHWTVLPSGTTEYNVEFISGRFLATGYTTVFETDLVTELQLRKQGQLILVGQPGRTYRIEFSEDLAGGWQSYQDYQLPADGNPAIFRFLPTPGRRFFRTAVVE